MLMQEPEDKRESQLPNVKEAELHWVYIVRCKDGTLYTGYTNNLEERLRLHNLGKGAKYTRGRGPVDVVYYEKFLDKGEALRREGIIKKLNRQAKLQLVNQEDTHD